MERWADEDGCKLLNYLGAWMAEPVVENSKPIPGIPKCQ